LNATIERPQRNAEPIANRTPITIFSEEWFFFSEPFSFMFFLSLVLKTKALRRINKPPSNIESFSSSPKKINAKGYTKIKLN
jgi:hypothetical protein